MADGRIDLADKLLRQQRHLTQGTKDIRRLQMAGLARGAAPPFPSAPEIKSSLGSRGQQIF